MNSLEDQAVQKALSGDWQEAISLNRKILRDDPCDIEALSRLAYALAKTNDYKNACKTYLCILELDPYHPIAKKNLAKFQHIKKTGSCHPANKLGNKHSISPSLFVSDAQKTRIVKLINTAPNSVLNTVSAGQKVYPVKKRFELHIKDCNDTYIGTLPDDIGRQLIAKLCNKKECAVYIKNIEHQEVSVFIKWHL